MRQQLPYIGASGYNRSRTRSEESSIRNLDDAPPPPDLQSALRGQLGSPLPQQPKRQQGGPAHPPPPLLSTGSPPFRGSSASGKEGSVSPASATSLPSPPKPSDSPGPGSRLLPVLRTSSFRSVRGRSSTWDGGNSSSTPMELGSLTTLLAPPNPAGRVDSRKQADPQLQEPLIVQPQHQSTGRSRFGSLRHRQHQSQQAATFASPMSPFGTGEEPARDLAIAQAWLSSGSVEGTRTMGDGQTRWDDSKNARLGENNGDSSAVAMTVPFLPSTINEGNEETKEEISLDQRELRLGNTRNRSESADRGGNNGAPPSNTKNGQRGTSAVHGENRPSSDSTNFGLHRHQSSSVRWRSESSELSLSIVDDDEDYPLNDDDGSDAGSATHWQRRSDDNLSISAADSTGAGPQLVPSPSAESWGGGQPTQLCCGWTLPLFLSPCSRRIKRPSWNRVSSYVVRHAPCFWCISRLEASATDRAVLGRLNMLCAAFALVQVGAGVFLFIVQSSGGASADENRLEKLTPDLWSLNTSLFFLSFLGIILFVTMILTLRIIRQVNLIGAVRYMWALYWFLPIEILLVISLFDYHKVTDVWIRHWWLTPSFDWFRERFCAEGTSKTLCAVPIGGGMDFQSEDARKNEDAWCDLYFNSTDCSDIQADAQTAMSTVTYTFLVANGILGVVLIALLCLALTMLEGIISTPIVRQSKQANIPAWLTLPTLGCLAGGATLAFSPSSATIKETGSEVFWVGVAYISSSGSFLVAALLGWFISGYSVLNSRDKQHKKIAVSLFITTIILTIFFVGAIFAASVVFSVDIVDYGINDDDRGQIACSVDTANSCTNCFDKIDINNRNEMRQCPEWTDSDILKVLQTQLKQSATLAAIFLIYAFSALRFGFILRSHVSRYQIEYV